MAASNGYCLPPYPLEQLLEAQTGSLQADIRRTDKKVDRVFHRVERHDDWVSAKLRIVAEHLDALDEKFEAIDEKVEGVHERVIGLNGFYNVENIDQQLESIEEKVEGVDGTVAALLNTKLQDMDRRFLALDHKMSQNEARARNQRLGRLHQTIHKVTVMRRRVVLRPNYFPSTIRDFWNLRKKRESR